MPLGLQLPRMKRRWQYASLLQRISRPLADTILLAQVLGIIANFLFYSSINSSDFVGFIYVGGDIASLFAYFAFMLFGALFFWLAPRRFWMSMHPMTLGLAMLMLSTHRLWNTNFLLLELAVFAGGIAGGLLYRWVLLRPRDSLFAAAMIILLSRYTLPRELVHYAIAFGGTLLVVMVLAPRLARLRRVWRVRRVQRGATAAPSPTG